MLAELLLAAVVDTAPEGALPRPDTRCVVVGSGSMKVPHKYRVLRSPNGVDSVSGRLEAEDGKQTIYWHDYDPGYVVPMQKYLWAFHGAAPVIWKWPAIHGWRLWWHALLEFPRGDKLYVVTDGQFFLGVSQGSAVPLADLATLASTFRYGTPSAQCESAVLVPLEHAF